MTCSLQSMRAFFLEKVDKKIWAVVSGNKVESSDKSFGLYAQMDSDTAKLVTIVHHRPTSW